MNSTRIIAALMSKQNFGGDKILYTTYFSKQRSLSESLIFNLCKCRKMSQPQCHYTKYFVAIKTKMHVEDSLDSNKIFDFW